MTKKKHAILLEEHLEAKKTLLYRYVSEDTTDWEWGMDQEQTQRLRLERYRPFRETEACYVIMYRGKDKFILKKPSKKAFAYKHKFRALENYIARTEKYIWHMEHNLKKSKGCLAEAEKLKEK